MDELLKWRREFPILDRTTYMMDQKLVACSRERPVETQNTEAADELTALTRSPPAHARVPCSSQYFR